MALTIVDNRGILHEADDTTGVTSGDNPSAYTSDPDPIEATACLGMAVSTDTDDAYWTITSDDYSGGGTISIWVQDNGAMDTLVNGGIMIQVGDGTNRIGYHVGGSDKGGFRHSDGPVKWHLFTLDLANKPANFTTFAGSEANLDETAITQVGIAFKTLSKALGNTENCFWDISRFADNGIGIEVYGGTSGTPENLSTLATNDRGTGNQQAYGIIREVVDSVFTIVGNITLGDPTSTNDTYIDIENQTLAWEDRGLSSNNYYRFIISGNSTGVTDINIIDSVLTVPSGASASFDASNANVDDFDITGSIILGFDQGVTTGGSGQSWEDNIFIGCGQITNNGAIFNNSSIRGYEGTADTSALIYDVAVDPDGEMDGMTFEKGTAATHAIELGTNSPLTMTFRNMTTVGYNAANGQNDSTFHVKRTSGTVTINIIGGTGNFSYRTDGATVDIVIDPVTTTITVKDPDDVEIENARVLVEAGDGTGDLPFEESVSITRSGTTATVSHTAHGLETNDKVVIRGADQQEYNGIFQITVTDVDTYTYTVSGSPATPATGTITSTGVVVEGLTDVSGQVSATKAYSIDQNVRGKVREATGAPFFRPIDFTDTVDSVNGLTKTVQFQSDE